MTETATTAPAPTREVVGDLLIAVAELYGAVRDAELGQLQLIKAVAESLKDDGVTKALEALNAAQESADARWVKLDANWKKLLTVFERFAGVEHDRA